MANTVSNVLVIGATAAAGAGLGRYFILTKEAEKEKEALAKEERYTSPHTAVELPVMSQSQGEDEESSANGESLSAEQVVNMARVEALIRLETLSDEEHEVEMVETLEDQLLQALPSGDDHDESEAVPAIAETSSNVANAATYLDSLSKVVDASIGTVNYLDSLSRRTKRAKTSGAGMSYLDTLLSQPRKKLGLQTYLDRLPSITMRSACEYCTSTILGRRLLLM